MSKRKPSPPEKRRAAAQRVADDIDPAHKAQIEESRKALDLSQEPPPTPHPGRPTPDDGPDPLSQNDLANVQGSAQIGGQPAALSRSHGARKSDQG